MNNYDYVNGIIAVKETYLIKEKFDYLLGLPVKDALKQLCDLPYGQGVNLDGETDYKSLVDHDEKAINDFIQEFAPSISEKAFFLLKNDYENLKTIVKSDIGGFSEQNLFSSQGLYSVEKLKNDYKNDKLNSYMSLCVKEIKSQKEITGSLIGNVVLKYYYLELLSKVKRKPLRQIIKRQADLINVLKTLKTQNVQEEKKYFLKGDLPEKAFLLLADEKKTVKDRTSLLEDLKDVATLALNKGYALAEKQAEIENLKIFSDKRYSLSSYEPFCWYVLQRKTENKNVKILFSSKLAGLDEEKIKQRLIKV